MIATLRRAFPAVAPYTVYVPAFDTQWGLALCGSSVDAQSDAAAARADAHAAACGGLRFYDLESHRGMFNVPKYLREAYPAAAPLM